MSLWTSASLVARCACLGSANVTLPLLSIATSTLVGIIESKRIREEVKKMDFSKQGAKSGWLQAAYANAMKRAADAQKNAQSKAGAPAKKYRDR